MKRYRGKIVKHRVPFPTINYQLCLYHFRAFSLASWKSSRQKVVDNRELKQDDGDGEGDAQ